MSIVAPLLLILLALVCLFQLALIAGAPWGELTLGGRWRGRLPLAVRAIPAISLLLLIGFMDIVAARAGLAFPEWAARSQSLIWVVVAYCGLGIVANAATPSARERRLWLPVLIVLTALSLGLALA